MQKPRKPTREQLRNRLDKKWRNRLDDIVERLGTFSRMEVSNQDGLWCLRARIGRNTLALIHALPKSFVGTVVLSRKVEEAAAPELSLETRAALALTHVKLKKKWFRFDLTKTKRCDEFMTLCKAMAG